MAGSSFLDLKMSMGLVFPFEGKVTLSYITRLDLHWECYSVYRMNWNILARQVSPGRASPSEIIGFAQVRWRAIVAAELVHMFKFDR